MHLEVNLVNFSKCGGVQDSFLAKGVAMKASTINPFLV